MNQVKADYKATDVSAKKTPKKTTTHHLIAKHIFVSSNLNQVRPGKSNLIAAPLKL